MDARSSVSADRKVDLTVEGDRKVSVTDDGVVPWGATTVDGDGPAVVSASVAIDPAAERRLVWKFDRRILPTLAVMYLFNALDKSNLGNAKTAGLERDLGLTGDDYNRILSIFFVPYVLAGPVVGLASKRFGPQRTLPLMMLVFGFSTLMAVAVTDFGGLLATRWFLGMVRFSFPQR